MGLRLGAFLWGLAEATLFFIVPDVLLSAVALRERAIALRLCLWTLGGALLGGLGMYLWGRHEAAQAGEVLAALPAIDAAMLARVGEDLQRLGALATFVGPLSGTPYKIYAALAPEAGIPLVIFLAVSIPARLIRFALVVVLTAWGSRTLLGGWPALARLRLLLVLWGLFYTVYFLVMPW